MRCLSAVLLLCTAACTPNYPLDVPGTWSLEQAPSANDANLRTMVVDQRDLIAGRGETSALGAEAAPPITNLLAGHRAKLPGDSLNVVSAPASDSAPAGNTPNAGQ